MALEERNGHQYFYSKKRVNGRVVSTYEGKGELAVLLDQFGKLSRAEAEAKAEQEWADFDRETEPAKKLAALLDEQAEHCQLIEDALFLKHGYRKHSRTWRRMRGTS